MYKLINLFFYSLIFFILYINSGVIKIIIISVRYFVITYCI